MSVLTEWVKATHGFFGVLSHFRGWVFTPSTEYLKMPVFAGSRPPISSRSRTFPPNNTFIKMHGPVAE